MRTIHWRTTTRSMRRGIAALLMGAAMTITGVVTIAPAHASELGQFHLNCNRSKSGRIDPIMDPHLRSMHRHDLFGNRSINKDSTYAKMLRGRTSCEVNEDRSGYWAPAMVRPDGSFVRAVSTTVYYWGGDGNETVRAFPKNFRMIAGGDTRRLLQSGYNCGEGIPESSTPLDCGNQDMKGVIIFPSCWDGVHSGVKGDHRSHMAYPDGGECKGRFPVTLPKLILHIRYPVHDGRGLSLVSDQSEGTSDGMSLHADFWNVWQQDALEGFVSSCINAGKTCSLGS